MVGENINKPVLSIDHHQLDPARHDSPNKWSSTCPACDQGILPVIRDQTTLVILEVDRCLLCGQEVKYTDIEDMRRKDAFPNF